MRIGFGQVPMLLLFVAAAGISPHYNERAIIQKFRIKPKPCYGSNGRKGMCMFNYQCNQAKGTVLATCVQGFLFGACCQLAPGEKPISLDSSPPVKKNTETETIIVPNIVNKTPSNKYTPVTSRTTTTNPVTKLNTWIPEVTTKSNKLSTWSFVQWISETSMPSLLPFTTPKPTKALTTSPSVETETEPAESYTTTTTTAVTLGPQVTFADEYVTSVYNYFETSGYNTYTETTTKHNTLETTTTTPYTTTETPTEVAETTSSNNTAGLVTWSSILWPNLTYTPPMTTKQTVDTTTSQSVSIWDNDNDNLVEQVMTTLDYSELLNNAYEKTTRPGTTESIPALRPEFVATRPQFLTTSKQPTTTTALTSETTSLTTSPNTTTSTTTSTTTTTTTTTSTTTTPSTTTTTTTPSTTTTTTTSTTTTTPTTTTTTTKTWNYKQDCGVRPITKSGRIVGGGRANFGDWPWQVLVRESTWLGLFTKNKCGGVLINKKFVLTAAHCQPGFLASLVVVFGEFDISGDFEPMRTFQKNVRRVVIHKEYVPATFENDIALLELDSEVDYRPHVLPICLPVDNSVFLTRRAIVSGWGRLRYGGKVPTVLHQVEVPVISNADCQKMFLEAGHVKSIRDSFLCAGYQNGEKDSCEGDSGGPLMVRGQKGRWVLAGTVSHGIKCAYPNMPGVYMRMTYYKPWIRRIAGDFQEWPA